MSLQKCILACVDDGSHDVKTSMDELAELANTAGAEVIETFVQKLDGINNATYIGSGKLLEIKEFCEENQIELVIFDDELSGSQIRNIENYIDNIKVIDRTMLILDIFAQRASSKEGKLQVELAQQKYILPRLSGIGTDLSRQGGGIGTRGPGETKLESDRRHIRNRISSLNKEIQEVSKRRNMIRERRNKNGAISVAVVGYTNVGKSTLLNILTEANILAKNQLFATLDPTARELKLPDGQTVILIDTVGFIRRLPHLLVEAFKSTLEEAANADLILNLCDISSDQYDVQLKVTEDILKELGCGDTPIITVYNKCDLCDMPIRCSDDFKSCFISAKNNQGIDELLKCICENLSQLVKKVKLKIPYTNAGIMGLIRKSGTVISENYENDSIVAEVIVDKKMMSKIQDFII